MCPTWDIVTLLPVSLEPNGCKILLYHTILSINPLKQEFRLNNVYYLKESSGSSHQEARLFTI